MKHYEEILKMGCFSLGDFARVTGNMSTAKGLLREYCEKGYAMRVKRGLYIAVNLVDNEPVANKFVIASKLTDSAYISHRSAFEYYGLTNQVSYEVTVSSRSKFLDFSFNGNSYHRRTPNIDAGVLQRPDGIRITDMERTVLDAISDFEYTMSFEELANCLAGIPAINEQRLISYLGEYGTQFMYQKAGYILERFRSDLALDRPFFDLCLNRMGKSSRYLTSDTVAGNMEFCGKWHLTIPKGLWENVGMGETTDANI